MKGTQAKRRLAVRVSNSKIKTYRRCPNKYRYKYPMKLRPKAKALPLELGSWCHELLQTYYDGEDWRETQKGLVRKFNALWDEERESLGDLPTTARRLMRAYLRRYAREDTARYRVVDSEMDEIITLPNGLRLQIIVDLIVEDLLEGGLWIWDHKFRKSLADPQDQIMDPQLTYYFWGVEHMGYTPLRGAMYNEVRTAVPKIPQLTQSGFLSKRKDIDTDSFTYMKAIRDNDLDPRDYADILAHIATREEGRFFQRTYLPKDPPVVKTMMRELVQTAQEMQESERRDRYPRTFDSSCKWGCEYKDLCIAELHGADIGSIIKQNFVVAKREEEGETVGK